MAPLNFIQDIYNESFDRIELLKRLDIASNSQLIKISMIPFGNSEGKVNKHDLVLLTHQSRARAVGNWKKRTY